MKPSKTAAKCVNCVVFVLCVAMETASLDMFLQEPEDSASFTGDPVTLKCKVNLETFAQNTHHMIVAWKQDNVLLVNSSSSTTSSSSSPSSSSSSLSSSSSSSSSSSPPPPSKGVLMTGNFSIGEYDLTFASASEVSSGNYTCDIYTFVTVQILGEGVHNVTVFVGGTDPAALTVLPDVRPVCSFSPDLQDDDKHTILTGTMLSFICSITEVNSFQLHWRVKSLTSTDFNDNFMEDAECKVGSNTTTLFYNRTVTPLDNGNVFECEMRSSGFPAMTRSCTLPPLSILYKPNVNIVPLSNISNIHVGDDLSFFCSVDASPLEDEIEWIVTPPQNIAFHRQQIEVHQASSPQNFINLTCQASNDIGMTSISISVHLRPVYKPLIYISMVTTSLNTRPEDGVKFRCNIDASPSEVTIQWVVVPRNHVIIQESGREMTLSSLSTESMYVDISCLVTNRVGKAMARVFIYLSPASLEQSTSNPYGSRLSSANTTEAESTAQYLVDLADQSATSETPLPETTSAPLSPNTTILEPNVIGSLPFSPFEEHFHTSSIPQATADSTLTEQQDTVITRERYPSITDTPVRSQGNAFTRP